MTEVSSMSENEGRPASLPPPPSERLPDLPTIFISDTEALPHKKHLLNKKPKKKHNTVSGVTSEAARVLEVLLKRSLSSSDANPHQSDSSSGLPTEHPPSSLHYPPQQPHGPSHIPRNDSYRHKVTEKLLMEKMEQLELSLSESQDPGDGLDEPDYVYPHEILSKARSISTSRSSSIRYPSSSSRSHSPSDKVLYGVHPPPSHTPHCNHHHRKTKPGKMHKFLLEDDESSSTEDYEYTDPNEFLRRKKKSFFRRATERLMHSFRRRKEHPMDFAEIDSPHQEASPAHSKCKKKKKGPSRLTSPFKTLSRRSTSSKPGSPTIYSDSFDLQDALCMATEVGIATGPNTPDNATHYTDIEQFHQESLKRKGQSPITWKKSKFKEGHLSDGGKDKSILDNFIRQIKKRGSFKIKRKDASKDGGEQHQQRCHSAENLISVRPLSKEQERILQHYAHTKTHGTGSDSELLAVKSLHHIISNRIEQQADHPQFSPSTNDGHRLLREKMRLDGLLRPAGKSNPFVEEPDYDEIEDEVDGLRFGSIFGGDIPKPFAERTEREKEMLYEKIAEQLAAIADHYNMESSKSQKNSPTEVLPPDILQESSGSSELEGATARKPGTVLRNDKSHLFREPSDLEKELASLLRDKGDSANEELSQFTPVVKEMIRNASYSKFKQIVNENIGAEPGWRQIAMMFRLTQTAVGIAGMGTAAALQIRENTLQYFEDKFANWIVNQGGWESVVEDTNSELD